MYLACTKRRMQVHVVLPWYKALLEVPSPTLVRFFSCNFLFPQLSSCICLSIQTLTLISELSLERKKRERRKEVGCGCFFFPPKIILESHKELQRLNHVSRVAANCQFRCAEKVVGTV